MIDVSIGETKGFHPRVEVLLVIVEIAISRTGEDPEAVGFHETDCRSLDSARLPSLFLYDAEPIGGAILERMRARFATHV